MKSLLGTDMLLIQVRMNKLLLYWESRDRGSIKLFHKSDYWNCQPVTQLFAWKDANANPTTNKATVTAESGIYQFIFQQQDGGAQEP
jgi:hypothetical protein